MHNGDHPPQETWQSKQGLRSCLRIFCFGGNADSRSARSTNQCELRPQTLARGNPRTCLSLFASGAGPRR